MKYFFLFASSDRKAIVYLSIIAVISILCVVAFGVEEKEERSKAKNEKITHSETIGTFDPNTVDSATLVSLGLSSRKVRTFIRYRNAGAVFRKPMDITRCYSFSDDDIDRLLPMIKIGEKYKNKKNERKKYPLEKKSPKEYYSRSVSQSTKNQHYENVSTTSQYKSNKFTELTQVDVNKADTSLLKKIPGVGDGIACMILRLRDKLGGFTSVEQLSLIDVMTPELMQWFKVDEDVEIRRININKASFKTLVTHPYITADQTKTILNYIRIYGKITDLEMLRTIGIFTEEELKQLEPYLEF